MELCNKQETEYSQPSHPAHPAPPIHPLQSIQSHQSAQLQQLFVDDVTQRAYPPLSVGTDDNLSDRCVVCGFQSGRCVVCGLHFPPWLLITVDYDGSACEPTCSSCLHKKRVGEILGIRK